jgi:hypothetical protein
MFLKQLQTPTQFTKEKQVSVWRCEEIEDEKDLVVVYREVSDGDGFVITAFLTKRKRQLEKRRKIWERTK